MTMGKSGLLSFCRYYGRKTESKDPNISMFFLCEQFWVENSERLTEDNDPLREMTIEYIRAGLREFELTDQVPLSLKAVLFNRYCQYQERVDVDGFKKFYKDEYKKG